MKRLSSKQICTSVVAVVTTATLVGCSQQGSGDDGDGESVVGVAAQPAVSPAAAQDVAGSVRTGDPVRGVVRIGRTTTDGGGSTDSEGKDKGLFAALGDGEVRIGSLTALADDSAKSVQVDPSCSSVTGTADGIVLGCGETVKLLDRAGKETRSLDIGATVTAAAANADGTVVVSTDGSDKVRWYDGEGGKVAEEGVSAHPTAMVPVGNARNSGADGGQQWRVAVLDAGQSSIADIDMDKKQYNAALRVGQGLGTASAGREADGVVVASDPRESQALVYTFTDVIRHTEAVPTGPGPWAVLWDSARELMWVSTTGDNRLTAYSLSTGVPVSVGHVDTVANVRYLIDGEDGSLLLIAEDGTRELIPNADLPSGR